MAAIGFKGGASSGYAVIYFKEQFKVEHKISEKSKLPGEEKNNSDII